MRDYKRLLTVRDEGGNHPIVRGRAWALPSPPFPMLPQEAALASVFAAISCFEYEMSLDLFSTLNTVLKLTAPRERWNN